MAVTAKKANASIMEARRIGHQLAEQLGQRTRALGLTYENLVESAIEETKAIRNEHRGNHTDRH
jgi:hypothetical protein